MSENPGLDTFDPRFSDITTLIQERRFSAAASLSQSVLEDEIYDIRVICYFLYGEFHESGPAALETIFSTLVNILGHNFEAVGPVKNRGKQTKNSMAWLLKQINKILEREEKKGGETWTEWQESIPWQTVKDALDAGEQLKEILGFKLESRSPAVLDGLTRTCAWLDAFSRLIYTEPQGTEQDTAPAQGLPDGQENGRNEDIPADTASGMGDDSAENAGETDRIEAKETGMVQGSHALAMLLKKMDAFERLLVENKTAGAALVSQDISQAISNFDPRVYFPGFFSKYTRLYAMNVEKLLAFNECRNSELWRSMEDLYRIDMDGFVAMADEFHYRSPQAFTGSGRGDQEEAGYEDNGEGASPYEDDY